VIPSSSRPRDQIPGAELSSNEVEAGGPKKKPRHRAGKKRRKRRESFVAPTEGDGGMESERVRPRLEKVTERASQEARESFYRLGRGQKGSATSLESEALLDHRYVHLFLLSGQQHVL
jgi:magnesium transporter